MAKKDRRKEQSVHVANIRDLGQNQKADKLRWPEV